MMKISYKVLMKTVYVCNVSFRHLRYWRLPWQRGAMCRFFVCNSCASWTSKTSSFWIL